MSPLLKPFSKVFVVVGVYGRLSVDDRRKPKEDESISRNNDILILGAATELELGYLEHDRS